MNAQEADKDFLTFIAQVKQYAAIDLAQYKEAQMRRRLMTFYTKHGFASFTALFEAMKQDKTLYHAFLDRMTINVSEFWRNANRWETLATVCIPQLARRSSALKCWSAACSTGEEPYTLAMILDRLGLLDKAKVLATDIDEGALEKAKEAVYSDRSLREVPASYVAAYFQQNGATAAVVPKLKQAVRFVRQNLLHDPFETQFDLIVCRNVMIYFTEEAKHMLYHKFAQALRPGGMLFVGSTEQIFSPGQYGLEAAETFVYRKKESEV